MSEIHLKVFSNVDDVHLVWTHADDIPRCLGFAIECRWGDAEPKYLSNRGGFEEDVEVDGDGNQFTSRSSQIWPFQRYDWTDHAADLGDVIAYRVVARVVGTDGKLNDGPSSEWSRTLTLSADCGDGVSVHFNRGYVLSQFMARYMKRKGITLAELKETAVIVSEQVDREARSFLGGTLRETMLRMMAEVAEDGGLERHAALYELSDEELVDGLVAIGGRISCWPTAALRCKERTRMKRPGRGSTTPASWFMIVSSHQEPWRTTSSWLWGAGPREEFRPEKGVDGQHQLDADRPLHSAQ